MKLHQSIDKHENDKPVYKNNAWFADTETKFCVVSAVLENFTFFDKKSGIEKSGIRWSVSVIYRDENNMRQQAKLTFSHSPDNTGKWDGVFGDEDLELPGHNFKLGYNAYKPDGTGDTQKGYSLVWTQEDDAACVCHGKQASNGHATGTGAATADEMRAILLLSPTSAIPLPDGWPSITSEQAQNWLAANKGAPQPTIAS